MITTATRQQADRRRLVRARGLRQATTRTSWKVSSRGIFDAMEDLKAQDAKQQVAKLDGHRLLDSGERRASACSATRTRPTTPRIASSS